jgi:hypothetical protein
MSLDTFVECSHCGLLVSAGTMPETTGILVPGNHEPVECEGIALPSETAVCPGSEMLGRIVQERPRFAIVKWWPAAAQARQPATRETFSDYMEAARVMDKLKQAMPGRCFAIEELPDD